MSRVIVVRINEFFHHFMKHSNFAANCSMEESQNDCSHLSRHTENENKPRKRWFMVSLWTQTDCSGIYDLTLFRFMSIMMVQTKCKLNNTELFSNCSIFRAKKLQHEETREVEKWQSEILPEYYWHQKGEERLLAECNKNKNCINFVKGWLHYFSSKSTTTASVYLMQSLLDNWLKNNHYIRFNIIAFTVCLHLRFFMSLSF